MGPNYLGEILFPVVAEYDPETNMTKVGFSYMMPPELKRMYDGAHK